GSSRDPGRWARSPDRALPLEITGRAGEEYFEGRSMARGTHGEGGGQARGGTDSDEVLEGVFGSCAAVPSGGSHGECEMLRPVPDRDATGPRVPPRGCRRQPELRLLPGLGTGDPGTWTA